MISGPPVTFGGPLSVTRHGHLSFGFNLSAEDWQDIKHDWASLVDFDPYEPDWRDE